MELREIDRLVAKKILGWKEKELPNNDDGLPYSSYYWVDNGDEKILPANFFNPSTNLEHVFKYVVEVLTNNQYFFKLNNSNNRTYVCLFSDYEHNYYAEASTVPLAICLAGLKAVGVDVNE